VGFFLLLRLSAIWKGFALPDLGLVGHAGRISFDFLKFYRSVACGLELQAIEELPPVVSVQYIGFRIWDTRVLFRGPEL